MFLILCLTSSTPTIMEQFLLKNTLSSFKLSALILNSSRTHFKPLMWIKMELSVAKNLWMRTWNTAKALMKAIQVAICLETCTCELYSDNHFACTSVDLFLYSTISAYMCPYKCHYRNHVIKILKA